MDIDKKTADEVFYYKLLNYMNKEGEMSTRQIYSLFPDTNQNTISWRLHRLVNWGKLHKSGHGQYSLFEVNENNAAGYNYLQEKSKIIYDSVIDYGYNFYLTGLDALVGEMLHIPEQYPVLLVVEQEGINEIKHILSEKDMLVLTDRDRSIISESLIRDKTDVFIFKGKDFSLSTDYIAQKEKGFVDLYYAVTRMEYGVSVQELYRIYQNLLRNLSLATLKIKAAAKDRGILTELNWLLEFDKVPIKAQEFMSYRIKEVL
ncbi:MAG: hypothetical protein LBD23_09660 [Oscillospiraceae bacterium]|jgi:hypothetical protein|nr:hypothetical protein [Oscillospiraceae bacterium]